MPLKTHLGQRSLLQAKRLVRAWKTLCPPSVAEKHIWALLTVNKWYLVSLGAYSFWGMCKMCQDHRFYFMVTSKSFLGSCYVSFLNKFWPSLSKKYSYSCIQWSFLPLIYALIVGTHRNGLLKCKRIVLRVMNI